MRSSMTFLLIASLLYCPFRCATGAGCADSFDVADADVVCHSCCDACDRNETQGEELPQPGCPREDCDCQACICRGAIVDGEPLTLDRLSARTVWLPLESLACQSQTKTTSLDSVDHVSLISRFVSGRAMRIGLQSFQI